MKILAHCSTYGHNASSGADKMMQSLLEYLVSRETEIRVVIDDNVNYQLNGVNVLSNKSLLGEQYDWCDVVMIHLVAMHEANIIAKRFNKPIVHICHNAHIKLTSGFVIYNSHWLAQSMNLDLPSIVVHPPTKIQPHFKDNFNKPYITQINVCENKGGKFFFDLARQAYKHRFLGIHGGYGAQMSNPLPNIIYRPYNASGTDLSDTRIVIIPSKMESWSLVASEAMANSIPVICSDLPGLRENCGNDAVYATTIKDYLDEIDKLSDENYYIKRAHDGYIRVKLHNYADELNNLYNFIENIVVKEKKEIKPVKEKKEIKPKKEKKEYKGFPTQQ